jgi:hypothetical protein
MEAMQSHFAQLPNMRPIPVGSITFGSARSVPRPHDKQDDPSGQCQPSKYWRKGNSLVSFFGDMHRSHIEDFFLTCVVDALIGEDQCAQND